MVEKKNKTKGKDLRSLLLTKLSVLLDVEHQLVKTLPKLSKAATDKDLKAGLTAHLEETKGHVRRLEKIFSIMGEKPEKSMKSAGIRGIIEDGSWVIKNVKPKEALDANLIAAASYAEHYEMAGYMAAKVWAQILGLSDVSKILGETLKEEQSADESMTSAGEARIFKRAAVEEEK